MPLYDYACTQCGHTLEVRHGFDETYAQPCPKCGSAMRRVFNAAPILFKGSGFYVTDSRKPAKTSKPTEKPAEKPAEKAAESKSESSPAKTDSSPAKTETKPADSAA